jgi:hypothetical protein
MARVYIYHLQREEGGGEELEVTVEPAAKVLKGRREFQLVVQRDQHVARERDGGERGRPEQPQLRPVHEHLRRLTHQRDRRQEAEIMWKSSEGSIFSWLNCAFFYTDTFEFYKGKTSF